MTRAIIGIPTKEGIACYVVCSDGYFSGWGAELFYHFNNEKTFPKLIKGFHGGYGCLYEYTKPDTNTDEQLI